MAQQFVLKTLLDFAAAHSLKNYPGDCAKLHGHNWKIEVQVQGSKLNEIGMLVDFKEIKKHAKQVVAELDHTFLNDHPYFKELNPTAENIAVFLYREIESRIQSDTVTMHSLTVWENDRNCVIYSEND
ncbi:MULTISPECIES: 6-carboxytetrahydropterin synthase QueD [Piscirickettsiaceae]|jgi:6-pyruvoyltetrahydropterin/6-carboxytetrahydropterin synthase|uniref:6-carboxy-5,6,7,8-tetrahydropterin synthase n=1 Tax=Hydrogenovibrio thermophilus TaxID=265883 RepID=A0A410H3M1_9GAMM|nr:MULTISPECIES: 6-carboxytetrahydropterin synthase QueD [Piscirickettsiaceae]AZR81940.1 6-pyruvoyl tetrahydropterin synthase [Thiomicrospira sp. S5]QAB15528.1 6-carboxytetrahydropterin synthase QueD [Hydrogenovibrio thermophilus]